MTCGSTKTSFVQMHLEKRSIQEKKSSLRTWKKETFWVRCDHWRFLCIVLRNTNAYCTLLVNWKGVDRYIRVDKYVFCSELRQFRIGFHDYWQVVAIFKSTFICIWWWGEKLLHLPFVICSLVAAGDVHKAKALYINLNRKSIGRADDTDVLREHSSFLLKAHLRSLPISFQAVWLQPGLCWCLARMFSQPRPSQLYWDLRVVN